MKRILLAVLILSALSSACLGNDTLVTSAAGGTVKMMSEHKSIRMVSEKVDVKINSNSARVHCKFVFKNEGPSCTVEMGFPDVMTAGGAASVEPNDARMKNFRSWVDGRLVETKIVPSEKEKEQDPDGRIYRYTEYRVKKVSFQKNQTLIVEDEYDCNLGMWDYVGKPGPDYSFKYILRSGAAWKGKIGKAEINVDCSALPLYYEVVPEGPDGWVMNGKSVSWVLTDFEPGNDVYIDLVPRYPLLNGNITFSSWSPYYIKNGVAMASIRPLEELGAEVECDPEKNEATIKYGDKSLKLVEGSKTAWLGGEAISLPQAPEFVELYWISAPIAAVVKALGGSASYDSETGQVYLYLKKIGPGPYER